MWYLCSLRPKLAEVFIKNLWRLVLGVHVAPVTRQSAAAFISSFLARAKFIRIEYVFFPTTLHKTLNNLTIFLYSFFTVSGI